MNGVRDKWDNIPWKKPVARDFDWFLERDGFEEGMMMRGVQHSRPA